MTPEQIIDAATRLGATVLRAPGADVIVFCHAAASDDDQIPLPECAHLAKETLRNVKDAIRGGELTAFGKKHRSVRRADLMKWIESRRVRARPEVGPIDDDIRRRMREIAREERALAVGGGRAR